MITIRHRAWLAWRSPPGLSRWRAVLPEDAGIGAAAHRCAQAASLRSRPGWSPAAMSSSAAVCGADPVEGEQPGGARGDQGDDELVEAVELAVEELRRAGPARAARCGWRSRRRRRDGAAAPRVSATRRGRGVPGEPGPQVIGAGQDQGPGLVDRLGPLGAGAALGDHQRPDRLDRAVPALRRAAGPAGLRGPGGADRVQRVGLALPAAVLPVGAVHLDDPDAGRGDVAGQARAVAAGPLDPDQARRSRTRPASPAGRHSRPRWPGTPGRRAARRSGPARRRRARRRGCPRRR